MAHLTNRLSARAVATMKDPGRHADGGGLYLVVEKSGAKRWCFLFRFKDDPALKGQGRLREMGLGPLTSVSLAEAREAADKCRRQVAAGVDPIAARQAASRPAEAPKAPTFGSVADDVVKGIAPGLRNAKHLDQWKMTLGTYAAPLRDKPVDEVTTDDVVAVLSPLWQTIPETASRLRGRIERVLDAAKVRGLRTGDNPARWRGHLELLLPKRHRLTRGHHAAADHAAVPGIVARLRATAGMSAAATEFLILTAARTGEVLGARWPEVDLQAKLWTVPASRMKAGKEHRVPLSERAVAILTAAETVRHSDDGYVFPSHRRGKPLSQMALLMCTRRIQADSTPHGFRSSFRDWAGDCTEYPRDVVEQCLAHAIPNEVEAAYRRSDALEKRRRLMDEWAKYVEPRPKSRVAA